MAKAIDRSPHAIHKIDRMYRRDGHSELDIIRLTREQANARRANTRELNSGKVEADAKRAANGTAKYSASPVPVEKTVAEVLVNADWCDRKTPAQRKAESQAEYLRTRDNSRKTLTRKEREYAKKQADYLKWRERKGLDTDAKKTLIALGLPVNK